MWPVVIQDILVLFRKMKKKMFTKNIIIQNIPFMDQLTNTEGVLLNFFQVLYPNLAEFIVKTVSRFDYAQGIVGMYNLNFVVIDQGCPNQCPAEFSCNQLKHTCQ